MELHVKKLAGRKLVMEYLSSVCLFKGGMHLILALSGSIPLLKLLLMQWLMVCLRLLQVVLLVLVQSYIYLCISHCQYFLQVVLHHKRKPSEGGCFPLWDFFFYVFYFYSFDTFNISKRLNKLLLLRFCCLQFPVLLQRCWFSSAIRALYNIYVVVIGSSWKLFFFS